LIWKNLSGFGQIRRREILANCRIIDLGQPQLLNPKSLFQKKEK
jgi:hypothetical protein